MQPRLIGRTHYQADEPAITKLLVLKCTSATSSEYPERAAAKLVKVLGEHNKPFNVTAARYAVDLARSLRLLNDNTVWTELAQVLNTVGDHASAEYQLSLPERLLYFRLFLETDGAALLFVLRSLAASNQLPRPGEGWPETANELVLWVFGEYQQLVSDTAQRVAIRRVLQRRASQPYAGKSGAHQMFVHMQALHRMGLIAQVEDRSTRCYTLPAEPQRKATQKFLGIIPDIASLEMLLKNGEWIRVAGSVFESQLPHGGAGVATLEDEVIISRMKTVYDQVLGTGVTLCPIASIVETLQIRSLADGEGILAYQDVLAPIERLRKQRPREVRFHVDRLGRPAFIKLAEDLAC